MKTHITDAFQIMVALFITIGIASAMAAPEPPKLAHKAALVVKAVQSTIVTPKAVAAAPVQPQPVLTPHQEIMQEAGIAPSDWPAADYIISHESGWCATKWEGEIGYCPPTVVAIYSWDYTEKGYGVCQSTPADKMAIEGADWQTNPVTQLKWCSIHAAADYGGWWGAYNYWVANHHW